LLLQRSALPLLASLVFFTPSACSTSRPSPATTAQVILRPSAHLSTFELVQSAGVIRQRFALAGLSARIGLAGDHLRVQVSPKDTPRVAALVDAGRVSVRQVLVFEPLNGATQPAAGPIPAGSSLTAAVRYFVSVGCPAENVSAGSDAPNLTIACDAGHRIKYLLGPPTVGGDDVASAEPEPAPESWHVLLHLTKHGSADWYRLTARAFRSGVKRPGGCDRNGCAQTAADVDGVVYSPATIDQPGIHSTETFFANNFDEITATTLALTISHRLPCPFGVSAGAGG
jgi:hypothetical protein